MSSARRFGLENSETRASLLDAAEQVMCEEGYAAVTSRRVASKAGLKPQLVHYYFRTMDDLFLAMLRRRTEHNRELLAQALASAKPLRALWEINTDPQGTALIMEMSALANHRKAIRAEIARYGELVRAMQAEAFSRFLPGDHVADDNARTQAPVVWSLLMTSISCVLSMERALGMSSGHAEMLAQVERYLCEFESRCEATAAV